MVTYVHTARLIFLENDRTHRVETTNKHRRNIVNLLENMDFNSLTAAGKINKIKIK